MKEKPVVALVIAAIVCPICMLSILAPVSLGSAVAGVSAWFGGFDPVAAAGLAVIPAILIYGFLRRRRDRHGVADSGGGSGQQDESPPWSFGGDPPVADEPKPTTPVKPGD